MQKMTVFFILSSFVLTANAQNVGIGTNAPIARLHVNNGSVVFSSVAGGGAVPVSGAGRRLLWFGDRAALRVGQVTNNNWDTDSIGVLSVAMGFNTKATGLRSIALGEATFASGTNSIAMGTDSKATNFGSIALGEGTIASGTNSIAMGSFSTTASGINSIAIGLMNTTSGAFSTAFGLQNAASGNNSSALGTASTASGQNSFTLGHAVNAVSLYETAFGCFNTDYIPSGSEGQFIGTDRLVSVGNGQNISNRSDALVILKNGDFKIGPKGTFFTNVQEGLINAGSQSGNNKKTVTLTFPNAFNSPTNVRVQLTPRTANGITDVFVLGVRNITNTQCTVDIFRADAAAGTGWGSAFDIQWMAWE